MADYRPLTVLNTDFKLLTRITANHLNPLLANILSNSQHCGIAGSSIFDALTTIRDAVAYAEAKTKPLCTLSLDFQGVFVNVSHEYLEDVLQQCGFSDTFRARLQTIYRDANSSVQINGFKSTPIQINSSIRQVCPLIMSLFIMCLNPFLCLLQHELQGIRINKHQEKTTAVAYADDVAIFLTTPTDIPKLQTNIQRYEEANGARININKSCAVAIGPWNREHMILNIPYKEKVNILGMTVNSTVLYNSQNKETGPGILPTEPIV
jgi:hypothetical protein